jgi:hypothetical protein
MAIRVRDQHRHLGRVAVEGAGDLQRRQHQPSRRVEDDVDRRLGIGLLDRPDHLLGIVHVDVADDREAEEPHRLLAMDQDDDPGAALGLDLGDLALSHQHEEALADHRLQGGEDEEEPEQLGQAHRRLRAAELEG